MLKEGTSRRTARPDRRGHAVLILALVGAVVLMLIIVRPTETQWTRDRIELGPRPFYLVEGILSGEQVRTQTPPGGC